MSSVKDDNAVQLTAKDLVGGHATYCPNPKMTLWNAHPRVFLDVGTTGRSQCPYCGTVYVLKPGEAPRGH